MEAWYPDAVVRGSVRLVVRAAREQRTGRQHRSSPPHRPAHDDKVTALRAGAPDRIERMSDPGTGGPPQPPPPGWQPPPPPAPSYTGSYAASQPPPPGYPPPPPTPGAWAPAPGMLGAAHKPGAMPLRPLGLGDMYDAAFRIIRFNPKATVGSAVLVAAVAMADPGRRHRDPDLSRSTSRSTRPAVPATRTSVGLLGLVRVARRSGSCCSRSARMLVTGMIAHVTAAAAVGRRLTPRRGLGGHPRQALAADRPGAAARARRRCCSIGRRTSLLWVVVVVASARQRAAPWCSGAW